MGRQPMSGADITTERDEEQRAVDNIGAIIDERVHAMLSHSSVYSSDREAAQMRAEAERLAEDMARVRARLTDYSRLEATLAAELKRSEAYAREVERMKQRPTTMREQAQLDNYGYEPEDIEKGELRARAEKAEAELDDLKKKYEGAKALLFGEQSELATTAKSAAGGHKRASRGDK